MYMITFCFFIMYKYYLFLFKRLTTIGPDRQQFNCWGSDKKPDNSFFNEYYLRGGGKREEGGVVKIVLKTRNIIVVLLSMIFFVFSNRNLEPNVVI